MSSISEQTSDWWAPNGASGAIPRDDADAMVQAMLLTGEESTNKANLDQAIHEAATHGALSCTKCLLDHGADVNNLNSTGMSPLLVAAKSGHEEEVKLLIQAGADIRIIDSENRDLLGIAVAGGFENLVRLCVEELGIDVNCKSHKKQWTPLNAAAVFNHLSIAKFLLTRQGIELNSVDTDGNTAFMNAASNGSEEIVTLLLNTEGVDKACKNKSGRHALYLARENPWVAVSKRIEVVKLLKACGAYDEDAVAEQELYQAAGSGNLSDVERLIANGTDVNAKQAGTGNTALMAAAGGGHMEVVKFLVGVKGIRVRTRNAAGERASKAAINSGYTSIILMLLDLEHSMVRDAS